MDLQCFESQLPIEIAHEIIAFHDPVIFNNDRSLRNLMQIEQKYIITSSYFKCVQTEIKPGMRKTIADWMWEVCDSEKCPGNVFPLAMNYLDRFLSLVNTRKSVLQLIGSVCIFLASKTKESRPISSKNLCFYTDNSISVEELKKGELVVLSRLKWDLYAITANDFLDHIFLRLTIEASQKARKHAEMLITLCATDFKFSMTPPSMIAAACVGAAVRGIIGLYTPGEDYGLLYRLHEITDIEVDCLRSCLEQIDNLVNDNMALPHTNDNGQYNSKIADMDSVDIKQCHAKTPTDVRDISFW